MGWLPLGDAACDTCGKQRVGSFDRTKAIQMLRAGGWHHMAGLTIGGVPFESILCRVCGHDEHRRPRTSAVAQQEELPLDWEEGRTVVGAQGVQSR
jgi:hypothetical protein